MNFLHEQAYKSRAPSAPKSSHDLSEASFSIPIHHQQNSLHHPPTFPLPSRHLSVKMVATYSLFGRQIGSHWVRFTLLLQPPKSFQPFRARSTFRSSLSLCTPSHLNSSYLPRIVLIEAFTALDRDTRQHSRPRDVGFGRQEGGGCKGSAHQRGQQGRGELHTVRLHLGVPDPQWLLSFGSNTVIGTS